MITVKVANEIKEEVLSDWNVKDTIREVEEQLGCNGRIIIRPSETEPLVKVTVEGKDSREVSVLAGLAADKISAVAKQKKASKK